MNAETKRALQSAVEAVIADWTAKGRPVDTSRRMAYTSHEGGLRGKQVEVARARLDYSGVVEALSTPFGELMQQHHPEHVGDISSELGLNSKVTPGAWVGAIVRAALDESQTPTCEQLSTLVSRVETVIDEPDYEVSFVAPLHRFRIEGPDITLSNGLSVHRMTENELGEWETPTNGDAMIRECCLIGSRRLRKIFGPPLGQPAAFSEVVASFDQIVLALRTIRSGPVDFGTIFVRSPSWNPLTPYYGMGRALSSPAIGSFELSRAESALVVKRHTLLQRMHAVLSVAASRLSSASTRLDAHDRIIDAAIGLEALLLADTTDSRYRGELRFRFSLNYSMLTEDRAQREREFLKARDIYDLRSTIAHGGHLDDRSKIADQRLTLNECAELACDMLRQVFDRFLESPESPDCCKTEFWRRRYFGLA